MGEATLFVCIDFQAKKRNSNLTVQTSITSVKDHERVAFKMQMSRNILIPFKVQSRGLLLACLLARAKDISLQQTWKKGNLKDIRAAEVGSASVLELWSALGGGRESVLFFPSVLSELMMPISHQHGKLNSTLQKILNFTPVPLQTSPGFNLHRLLVFQKDKFLRYLIFGETVGIVTFHVILYF